MPSTRQQMQALPTVPYGPFQVQGVRFLIRTGGRCILGDDMGLGKTYQTVAWRKLDPGPSDRPFLVICPAFLKFNWQREFWRHTQTRAEVAEGMTPFRLAGKVWIINYDILNAWLPWLCQQRPHTLIADECQALKNLKAQRTKAFQLLAQQADRVVGLSGTPILNRPAEFFSMLHAVRPDLFPTWGEYAFRYCGPRRGFKNHWDFSGASNLTELHHKLAGVMLRRTKKEVLTQLPPKQRVVVTVATDNMAEYRKAEDAFIHYLLEKKGFEAAKRAAKAETLVRLGELKRLAGRGKAWAVLEWAEEVNASGQKLVVFAEQRAVVAHYHAKLKGSVMVRGDTPTTERQRAIDSFQNDPKVPYFVGSRDACAIGTTLHAASIVGITELGWRPADHDQAEDRIYRIGQTASRVEAYYFIGHGTIEEHIWNVVGEKRSVVDTILDGKTQEVAVQERVIEELLRAHKAQKAG